MRFGVFCVIVSVLSWLVSVVFSPSVSPCRRRSVPGGVSAPFVASVLRLARSFPGFGVCLVRGSSRSFSGFVAVCSFASRCVALAFSGAASRLLGPGCFCAVRAVGSRFRVSVPVSPCRPLRLGRSVGLFRCPSPVVRLRFRSGFVAVPLGSPSPVAAVVSGFSSFGFSGSRSPSPAAVAALRSVAALVPAGASVSVGCAAGVDWLAGSLFPSASVFSVASGSWGSGRSAFARRSAACVAAVAASGGLWVSLPSGVCPAGLVPCRSWRSASGSGSWGSLALAAGLGVPCLVFLPGALPPAWGFASVGGGWWFRPGVSQLSLL